MNNLCDEEWFGRKDVFNIQNEHNWKPTTAPVWFEKNNKRKKAGWQQYVDSKRMKIRIMKQIGLSGQNELLKPHTVMSIRATTCFWRVKTCFGLLLIILSLNIKSSPHYRKSSKLLM